MPFGRVPFGRFQVKFPVIITENNSPKQKKVCNNSVPNGIVHFCCQASSGASGGSLHGDASFKVAKAHHVL